MAVLEHFVNAITMFISYRIVVQYLGLEQLGLWSILLAIMSLTSVGTAGFASSAVKFVSKYVARNEPRKVISIIETTVITVLIFTIVMLGLILLLFHFFKSTFFEASEILAIVEILPTLVISFVFGFAGSVFLSSLDGLRLIHIRSAIGIISKVFFLLLVYLFINGYGLRGLAISLLVQNLIVLALGAIAVKSNVKGVNVLFCKFDKNTFTEIFHYGYQFQIISIFQMLVDPLTKFLLKSHGGLTSVGYFELIYKFLFHARQIIVVAISTFVPTVAALHEEKEDNLGNLFKTIFSITFITSIVVLTIVLAVFPVVMSFVKVNMNSEVNVYSSFIYLGLIFNLFAVTPFMFNLGTGKLKFNNYSAGVMAVLNIVFSSIIGYYYSGIGVIIGWMLAQVVSNLYLFFSYLKSEKIALKGVINKYDIILLILVILYLTVNFIFNNLNTTSLFSTVLISFFIPVLIIGYPLLNNDKFKFTVNYIKQKIRK
ncbi:oligosaccharide flippase family protein [Flavobacterium nackdongense]|nr:oligosaccharide flippase family protein [Flavobacterium nackdongense]